METECGKQFEIHAYSFCLLELGRLVERVYIDLGLFKGCKSCKFGMSLHVLSDDMIATLVTFSPAALK